ncbi:RagB/SusD family nutrient uptake outer membrane protein [Belliella sp. DSM 111904]|uniref:RagB/SusD family nutrient uptake outer membrane protein n=1 Tax=Belliella filtrata TaxID=2923435 RepID=A0ABS9UV99_9BACT|nr:RagB/SusD family nutrient uptake outer membrane protein [Belliella filtrata]MCH7408086.1 RagB/SusD family nutrient uptake outer membrane protein [Belliella filtrata]
MKNIIKNIKSICLPAILAIGVCGCDLDEFNPSGVTGEAVWESSPENFVTLVNAAYHQQRYLYGKVDGVFVTESGTDIWFNRDKRLWAAQFSQYNNFTSNVGFNNNVWREFWQGVLHCNAGINRIDRVEWPNATERDQRLGELRFLRAFYYWHIVETWGNVMLRTEEPSGPPSAERSTINELYDVIIADLEFAAESLPASWGDQYSRASKKSAYGFLARAALSRAYYDMNAEYFQLARDAAQTVIDRQGEFGVSLWDNYEDLYDPNNNRNNREVLYEVSNSTNPSLNYDGNANQMHQFFLSPYAGKPGLALSMEYGRDGGRQLMPTLALLDMYDEEIDARYHASFQEVWIANRDFTWTEQAVQQHRKDPSIVGTVIRAGIDTALYNTKKSVPNKALLPYLVFDRDSVYQTESNNGIRNGNDFVVLKKFFDPITRANEAAQPGFLNVFIMRLPEMYLIAAEAEHQLGNNGNAAEFLNVIRTRAAVKTPVDYTAQMQVTAADITLDFILDERARELSGEFLRWFDLKRTGTLGSRIASLNPDITEFREHHVLRPIPQVELDALVNGDEFGQNPGY